MDWFTRSFEILNLDMMGLLLLFGVEGEEEVVIHNNISVLLLLFVRGGERESKRICEITKLRG